MWPTAIITICKYLIGSWWCVSRSILCPSGRSVKSKFQVYIYASYECLTLRIYSSITRLESQNRKFPPILIITGPKNDHFFVCKQTRFVDQRLWDFANMTLTRISSHWLWLESSRVILWKTWLESSQSHQKSCLELSHWLESRYYCSLHSSFTRSTHTGNTVGSVVCLGGGERGTCLGTPFSGAPIKEFCA